MYWEVILLPSSKHKTLNYILIENMHCTLLLSILTSKYVTIPKMFLE